jgi:hypothetical protein
MTAAEVLVVLAILAALVLAGAPAAAHLRDGGRAAAGARWVATSFAAERWRAVTLARSGGYHFAPDAGVWSWLPVEDGNGNGLRTTEVRTGTDRAREARRRLGADVNGVEFGIPPGGPFPEAPPGTGTLVSGDDPVRFGRSDLVSFSPDGSASSGTLYVTDGRDGLCAVVLFGPTARVRVWRFDRRNGRWTR